MTASVVRSVAHAGRPGRLWWLPPDGYGNGLDDEAWVPALEISERVIPDVLHGLGEAGVPAYAASARRPGQRLRDHGSRPPGYRLWVGASAYVRAETALAAIMPGLEREAARHADSAWR